MSIKSIKNRIASYTKYLSRIGFDLDKSKEIGGAAPRDNNWQKINPIVERLKRRLEKKEMKHGNKREINTKAKSPARPITSSVGKEESKDN